MKFNNSLIALVATFLGMVIVSLVIISAFTLSEFLYKKYPSLHWMSYIYIFMQFTILNKFFCIPNKKSNIS